MKLLVDCGELKKMTHPSENFEGSIYKACEETSAKKIVNNGEQSICCLKEDEVKANRYAGIAFTEHEQCYVAPDLVDRKRNSRNQEEIDEETGSWKKPKYKTVKEIMEAESVENSLKTCLETVEEYNRRYGQLKDMEYHLVLAKAKLTIAQTEGKKFVVGKDLEQIIEGLKWFKLICDGLKELEKRFADIKQRKSEQVSKETSKDEITDNLKHTKKMLEKKLEHQCDRLKEIHREYGLVKAEYEYVAEERSKVWKKELQGLRQVLGKYEAAYRIFNEIFRGDDETEMDLEFSRIEEGTSKQNLADNDTHNCSI